MRRQLTLLVVGAALPALAAGAAGPASPHAPPGFERCEAAVRDHPERNESFRCFWEVARARKAWDEAARRLEAHLARDPANPRAKLTLAWVEWDRGGSSVERLFREAADGFGAIRDANGEVFARLGLAWFLRGHGRAADAAPDVERAMAVARASGDPTLVARVRIDQSEQAYARSEYGEALGYLREAEEIAVARGAKDILAAVLGNKAYGWWELGMYRQSMEAYARQADLYREMGSRWGATFGESRARNSVADLAGRLYAQGELERSEAVRLAREAVAVAVASGNRTTEADARLTLTQWLGGADAAAEVERALVLARATGDRRTIRFGLRLLARQRVLADPGRSAAAFPTIEEAIADARSAGDREDLARGLVMKAAMRLRTGARALWRGDSLAALDAIERIRDLQPEETIRALAFGPWAFAYYRFSGTLLAGLGTAVDRDADLDLAFATIERMRARVLLDCLDRAGAGPVPDQSNADVRHHTEVLAQIAGIQNVLAGSSEPEPARTSVLSKLERLEAEEESLRGAIARAVPAFGRAHPTSLATVSEIRRRLEPDQAIVSFQIGPSSPDPEDRSDDGGSWAVLVTRADARAFSLPERAAIEDAVTVYLGLCRRRDGSEVRAASGLYRALLEPALRAAGPGIRRLVVVPDGCLNRLPFGSLREGPAPGAPLALRLQISEVPSATLWLRWKLGDRAELPPARALALADPETTGLDSATVRAANPWAGRVPRGRLPHARLEAEEIARGVGGGSRILVGPAASKAAVTRADLGPYGVLHLAAHAIVDDARPERSAIVLAPGGGADDGLLQLREIARLRLERRVVVLTACRSASGAEVEGEGVVGLARGFFQAGASAVVGTLWPVRDDDMEVFVRAFARELHRGRTLAAAHAEAVRSAIVAGLPAAAWAGTVVLGDGDVVPVRGGTTLRAWVIVGVAAAAAAGLVWVIVALRRRRPKGDE